MLRERLIQAEDAFIAPRHYQPFPKYRDREAWSNLLRQPLNLRRLDQVTGAADEILHQAWPLLTASMYAEFMRTGNRTHYEGLYFTRRQNLGVLVLCECLSGSGRYFDAIIDGLQLICEESTWTLPAHASRYECDPLHRDDEKSVALFTCETAAVLSLTLYLLEEELLNRVPSLVYRLRHELEERILKPVEEDIRRFRWSEGKNNWTPWCVSNILVTAMFVLDDRQRLTHLIVEQLAPVIDNYLDNYPKDGCCDEGPMYWGKSPGSLLTFLEHLYGLSEGRVSLYGESQILHMGEFLANAHLGGIWGLNFSDASPKLQIRRGAVYRYGERIGSESMKSLVRHSLRQWKMEQAVSPALDRPGNGAYLLETMEEIFWGPGDEPSGELIKPLSVWYPHTEVMVARETTIAGSGLLLAAKGGNNGENHNHNDVGQFIIHLNGMPMIIDMGRGEYTRQTFSDRRYELLNNRSCSHNVPLINGIEQHQGIEYCAQESLYTEGKEGARTLDMDITGAYPLITGLGKIHRCMSLNEKMIQITDSFVIDTPHSIELNLYTPAQVSESEGQWRLQNGDTILLLTCTANMTFSVSELHLEDALLKKNWGETLRCITLSGTLTPLESRYSLKFLS